MTEELSGKIINVDGAILDTDKQRLLHDFIVSIIDEMKGKAEADERIKEVLERGIEEMQVSKAYLKGVATDLYKLETGKTNQEAIDTKAAAIEQLKEIYDDFEAR